MSQLWESLSPKDLVALVEYQWNEYGLKAELLSEKPFTTYDTGAEVEELIEIDHLMRERRPGHKG